MTEKNQIYKCELCGNIVEILHIGKGELVCCGKTMTLQKENYEGEYAEKHSPIIKGAEQGVLVKIGEIKHPMEKEHYIEWVEIQTSDGEIQKEFLNPEQEPQAYFKTIPEKVKRARMYCNIHGLWVKNNN